jgi:23S rRNA pseudouridine955/2504/2580 synthase
MHTIQIENPSDADQRIDKFLRKYFPNAPLSGIFKSMRTGKIKVNRNKVEQSYRIREGDTIECYWNEEEITEMRERKEHEKNGSKREDEVLHMLYEDAHILIVNKPSGVSVHPGDHKTKEASLIELVQDALGGRYDTFSFRPSLVHRIDRDTSGCVMIAKEKKALEALLKLLQTGKIEKIYHTIVIGTPKEEK